MDETKKIRLMIKEPYKPEYVTEIDDTYENMKQIIGGLLDCTPMPGGDHIDIFFDDEGLLKKLPGNIWLAGTGDCIKGTCYMVGYDEETGDNVSLTDNQIKYCKRYIKNFALEEGLDLYADYFFLTPIMYSKAEKFFKKSIVEM